jgi:hypothetical protein
LSVKCHLRGLRLQAVFHNQRTDSNSGSLALKNSGGGQRERIGSPAAGHQDQVALGNPRPLETSAHGGAHIGNRRREPWSLGHGFALFGNLVAVVRLKCTTQVKSFLKPI